MNLEVREEVIMGQGAAKFTVNPAGGSPAPAGFSPFGGGVTTALTSDWKEDPEKSVGATAGAVIGGFWGPIGAFVGSTIGGFLGSQFKNKDPDRDLWGREVMELTGNNPDGWGSGGDWSQWLQGKGIDKETADKYGRAIRSGGMNPKTAAKELGISVGGSTRETFEVPHVSSTPSALENDLVAQLRKLMPMGLDAMFEGEAGGQLKDLMTRYLDPENEPVDVQMLRDKATREILRPGRERGMDLARSTMGGQGFKATGGTQAQVYTGVEENYQAGLLKALTDAMVYNDQQKTEQAKIGAQIGEMGRLYYQAIVSEANKQIATRGSLDLGAAKANAANAVQKYMADLGYDVNMQKLEDDLYRFTETNKRTDEASENSYFDELLKSVTGYFTDEGEGKDPVGGFVDLFKNAFSGGDKSSSVFPSTSDPVSTNISSVFPQYEDNKSGFNYSGSFVPPTVYPGQNPNMF